MRIVSLFLHACVAFATLGLALPAQETRLANVSVRTSAGGADILITGFTIGPGPSKTVLVRAVGPTLGAFGVSGTLPDPKLELYNSASVKIAENDNFNSADAATFASVGAFPLNSGARDAALVATLPPGSYSAQVSGIGGASGVALVEVYEVSGGTTRLINLSTRAQVGTGANILIPGISIAPGAGTRRLLLRAVGPTLGVFGVPGTIADPKLELYSGSTKIAENDNWGTPVGTGAADAATLAAAFAANGAFALGAGSKDAALLLNLGAGNYTLQVSGVGDTTGAALVEVYDLTPVNQTGARPSASLYVARLRPDSTATSSIASGYATILINPDGTATVNVTFSNLSAAQTSAHLQLGASRDYVLNLPRGQVNGTTWTFAPSGAYTTNDLIEALNTGNIFVGLDSAKFPAGELGGNFVRATGSLTFSPPAAPPPLPASALKAPTQTDAARFLTQATFGPTLADINDVMARGIPAWIDAQMALPPSLHLAAIRADTDEFPNPLTTGDNTIWLRHPWNRVAAWWKTSITAPDQLRQRMAFALGQILVVSELAGANIDTESICSYNDILVKGAFGNFRQLLEDVSLNPAMGQMLSHRGNMKAGVIAGTTPDENYAREVQQLFTVGLVQLHPDGTLLLDVNGQPIPTYDQSMIVETAKVFTGWAFANVTVPANTTNVSQYRAFPPSTRDLGASEDSGWINPMKYFDAFHDKTQKRVIGVQQVPLAAAAATTIPAGQTGPQDLKMLLDVLFNHPNTGPFICRQLIQRFVTSNPSPGYVYRVAQVFANDGTGTRGNLGAVVKAIFTDYEARSLDVMDHVGYGKLKEPIIRLTTMFRALKAAAPNGRYLDSHWWGGPLTNRNPRSPNIWGHASPSMANAGDDLGQNPNGAPTVFNFFSPDFSPPGPLAAAGLVAPELEIVNATNAVNCPNKLLFYLFRDLSSTPDFPPPPSGLSPYLVMDYSALLPLVQSPPALIDQLGLLFCGNRLSAAARNQILATQQALAANTSALDRLKSALYIVLLSPDSAMQK